MLDCYVAASKPLWLVLMVFGLNDIWYPIWQINHSSEKITEKIQGIPETFQSLVTLLWKIFFINDGTQKYLLSLEKVLNKNAGWHFWRIFLKLREKAVSKGNLLASDIFTGD